jgi:hypothetical protein
MPEPLLIDTCGWIDFLRSGSGPLGDQVAQALESDTARMCSVTVTELLQGAKGKKEKQQLEFLFANVEQLHVEPLDWVAAGHTLQALRGKGITLPLTDALIAAVALRHGMAVMTTDDHFRHLAVQRV